MMSTTTTTVAETTTAAPSPPSDTVPWAFVGHLQCCVNCNTLELDMKVCPACRNARYCSRNCQVDHWTMHKNTCSGEKGDSKLNRRKKQALRKILLIVVERTLDDLLTRREFTKCYARTRADVGTEGVFTVNIQRENGTNETWINYGRPDEEHKMFKRLSHFLPPHGPSQSIPILITLTVYSSVEFITTTVCVTYIKNTFEYFGW